jgi:cell division protein FtsZ
VPGDGIAASSDATPAYETPRREPARPERPGSPGPQEPVAVTSDAGDSSSSYRAAHADGPAKTFDVASTRRRPVVFEEDDDLDVPDFLK